MSTRYKLSSAQTGREKREKHPLSSKVSGIDWPNNGESQRISGSSYLNQQREAVERALGTRKMQTPDKLGRKTKGKERRY